MGLRLRTACTACAAFAVLALPGVFGFADEADATVLAVHALAVEVPPLQPSAVRFANLTDDGGRIDLVLDGRLRVLAMVGGRTTDFMVVPAGQHRIGVPGGDELDGVELTVAPGASPTVLLIGPSARPSIFTLPETVDPGHSIRLVNASGAVVHGVIGGDAFDVEAGESHLAAADIGPVVVRAEIGELGDAPTVQRSFSVRPNASTVAVVTGTPSAPAIHAIAAHALPPGALALQADEVVRVSPGHPAGANKSLWIRRSLAALVIVLVFAATLSSLAVFRVESLEDRVRNRMR